MASPASRTPLDARTPLGTAKAVPHTTLIRKPVLPSHHFYFILFQNKILCPYFLLGRFNSHASTQAASKVEKNWNSEIPQIGRLFIVVPWPEGVDNVLKHMTEEDSSTSPNKNPQGEFNWWRWLMPPISVPVSRALTLSLSAAMFAQIWKTFSRICWMQPPVGFALEIQRTIR